MKRRFTGIDFFHLSASALYLLGAKAMIACVVLTVLCGTLTGQTIKIQSEEKQQMCYGLDYERLWYWYGPQANLNQCAQWSVVDCDVDYLRVAINCAYELQEGVYNLSAYTNKILPMMTTMKAANPNIKFFASPRPLDEALDGARWQPYPYWITGDPGDGSSFSFNWLKCAEYLVRYINLMKSYGFKIDYLDVTNEWNYVRPSDTKSIRDYMIATLGDDMPLIVAPSAWSFWEGYLWIGTASHEGYLDGFDIAACHNTGYEETPEKFADRALEYGKEVWDSEVHGWKGKVPADEIPTSSQMFDRIRAGFSGLNSWLAIGTTAQQHCYFLNNGSSVTRNVKYYIFKKLTTTSNYGHALDVNLPAELTSTAALIRDNLLTVWVLNNSSIDVPNVEFVITGKSITGGTVEYTKWHSGSPITGANGSFENSAGNRFFATINANSLFCFEITLTVKKADFDLDGWVGRYDLKDLTSEWLLSESTLVADIDDSGKVDLNDYAVLAQEWTGPDSQAPTPDPLSWLIAPTTIGSEEITMTASYATDNSGVEYYFNNVTAPSHDSGWQATAIYTDTNLAPETQYSYRVKARDKSHYHNETAWSATSSASTNPELEFETIFETFDSNPSARGWINAQAGNTTFTYNASGYLDAKIYRDSANTARFYKALNQNYDETDEFWFEYDARIVSATSLLQRALTGLFNYSVPDNDHDLLVARFAYWTYSGNPRGNRHDLYCYATDGTKTTSIGAPIDPGIDYGQNIRVKIHYWYESGLGKALLNIYAINADGSTGYLIMAAPVSTIVGIGKTLTLNAIGLGNRTDGSDSGENNVIKIDDMYFSAEAENPSLISPSF